MIECREIVKRYGKSLVLDRLNWSIAAGQATALVGASGAGKTTLLRIIAGLSPPTSGQVVLPPSKAAAPQVGMVFQNLALWPHLTARRHLECVLSRHPRGQRRQLAERWLGEVRLPAATWHQLPAQLSGGEAQRLAFARALAAEPQVLLLDEPLVHLDAALKQELLALVGRLAQAQHSTLIYVTQAWNEAAALGREVGVMADGRIVQSAPPDEVFWRPANRGAALVAGPLVDLPLAWLADGSIRVRNGDPAALSVAPAEERQISVRPQQLHLTAASGGGSWQVISSRPDGAGWLCVLARDGRRLELPCAVPPSAGEAGIELLAPAAAPSQVHLGEPRH